MQSDKNAWPADLAQAVDTQNMLKTQEHPVRLQKLELLRMLECQTKEIRAAFVEVMDSRATTQRTETEEKCSLLSSIFRRGSSTHSISRLEALQQRDRLQLENERLREKNDKLIKEKYDTQERSEILRERFRELEKNNLISRQETKRLSSEMNKINAQNFKLRGQLTRVDSEQTNDFEVVQKFCRLRYNC
ncbi:hypothetical protein DHEL01_v208125 [Diaporthe helianthi]|uniref:Uncharacterized protein n=1 Tax=Diaporthe helianthi TaxID=158607 RepID=A0A2P5HT91_DIAHE|nr:hypothetical protein DHEL01_v208125 [Diaporthe helianthi]